MVGRLSLLSLLLAGSFIQAEETKFDQWNNWTKATIKQVTDTALTYGKKGLKPIKIAALYWAALQVCGIAAGHLCNLLRKISPCTHCQTFFDTINPAVSRNMLEHYAKLLPWGIAFACLLGYVTEQLEKNMKKTEKAVNNK